MCTFCTELPKLSKSAEMPKKQRIYLPLKPSAEKEYYRFRLLWFKSASKSDRDYPFIESYRHTHFGKNDKGQTIVDDFVVCPVTPYVKAKWEDDPYKSCPICKAGNNNFIAFKESGYKDRVSANKANEFGRKFAAYVPVYVVNDPNYEQNNGKLKVFMFGDKKDYEQFKDLVNKKSQEAVVFNGKNAVDFYIRLETVTEVNHKGEPNEYTWSHNRIAQMGFTKSEKAYDIPAITKELIDDFEFDEQFYVTSSKEELQAYYNKYCKVQMDDIDEDEDVKVFAKPAPAKKPAAPSLSNTVAKPAKADADDIEDDLADLGFGTSEKKDEKKSEPAPKAVKEAEEVDDLPFDTGDEEPAKVPETPKAEETFKTELPKETSKSDDVSLDDIDDLLRDI